MCILTRIDGDGIIKVADFGLTEDIYHTKYHRIDSISGEREKVPVRWMAPESIETNLYNESTDVVSCVIRGSGKYLNVVWLRNKFTLNQTLLN